MGGGTEPSQSAEKKKFPKQSSLIDEFTVIEPAEVEREVLCFDDPSEVIDDMFDSRAFANVGSYLYYKEIRANKGVQTDFGQEENGDDTENHTVRLRKGRLLLLGGIVTLIISIAIGLYRQTVILEQRFLAQQMALEQEMAARQELEAQIRSPKAQDNQTVVSDSGRFCLTDLLVGGIVGGAGIALSGVGPIAETLGQAAGATVEHLEGFGQALAKEAETLSQEWNEGLDQWTKGVSDFIDEGWSRHNAAVSTLGNFGRYMLDLGSGLVSGTGSETSVEKVADVLSES